MLNEYIPNISDDFNEFIKYSKIHKDIIKKEYSHYCSTFSFTTENLSAYLNTLNVSNKKVLTVTSSGDHLINLALLNAKEVDCFDINRLSYYLTRLKLNLLMNLSYEDFIAYFTYSESSMIISNSLYPVKINEHCYDYNIYAKVRDKLEPDVCYFFDKIYEAFEYSGKRFSKSGFFDNVPMDSAKFNNIYLANPNNYYRAREKIISLYRNNKIKFYDANVFDIHEIEKKYNIVILSNIYDYIPLENANEFVEYIINELRQILAFRAKVIVEYQYCGSPDSKDYFDLLPYLKPLSKLKLKFITIPSIYEKHRDHGQRDCVYVYKR